MFRKRNQKIAGARGQAAPDSSYTADAIKHHVSDMELFQRMGIHVQQEGSA